MLPHPANTASYPVPAWFTLSVAEGSVQVFAVSLTSVLGLLQTTLRLANASGRYSAHKRLSLSGGLFL